MHLKIKLFSKSICVFFKQKRMFLIYSFYYWYIHFYKQRNFTSLQNKIKYMCFFYLVATTKHRYLYIFHFYIYFYFKMSTLKIPPENSFLHSRLDSFPENLGNFSYEQVGRFHKELKLFHQNYKAYWRTKLY